MRVFPSVKIPNYIKLKLLPFIRWFKRNPVCPYFFPVPIREIFAYGKIIAPAPETQWVNSIQPINFHIGHLRSRSLDKSISYPLAHPRVKNIHVFYTGKRSVCISISEMVTINGLQYLRTYNRCIGYHQNR